MKQNTIASIALALFVAAIFSTTANAGSDTDSDGIPDNADNCSLVPNPTQCDCSNQNQVCMSYLTAGPLTDKQKLNYEVSISASGNDETVQLQLKREDTKSYRGEVVLIHGFRAFKEFMVNSALYFRFIDFKVLVPDLLGHGESTGEISFGVNDSNILDELLDQRSEIGHPLLLLGNSMGAVAAAHLAEKRSDVAGLILQAPMMILDEAAVNYINSYSLLEYV